MLLGLLRLLFRRAFSERYFVVLRFLGLALAVATTSGVFIYLDALGQSALNDRLKQTSDQDLSIAMRGRLANVSALGHGNLKSKVLSSIGDSLGQVTHDPTLAAKSATLAFNADEVVWSNARAFLSTVNDLHSSASLIDGAWPKGGIDPVEVAISKSGAAYLGINTGDHLEVHLASGDSAPFQVRISGTYERSETHRNTWHAVDSGLGVNSQAFRVTPLMVHEDTLTNDLVRLMSVAEVRYYWILGVDSDAVKARDAPMLLSELDAQESVLRREIQGFQRVTALDRVLEEHLSSASISIGLMLAVGSVLAAACIAFAALVASKARDLRETESGMMRARGSTARQELLLMAGENLSVATVALLTGPFLALWFVTYSGQLPGLNTLTGGANLPASITTEAFVSAVGTCALGVLVMSLPTLTKSTQLVIQRLARPDRLTALQRYYVDLPILGLALVGIWQLSRGELRLVSDAFGVGFVTQLELAMPAVFAIAGALVLLRFLPLGMTLLSSLLTQVPKWVRLSPSVTLGLWTLARNPGSNFGLMLLVILSVCVAMVGAVLGPSLERHADESARHMVGADVRVSNMAVRSQASLARQVEIIRGLEGVQTVSEATRTVGTVNVPSGTQAITVLGVDPDTFSSVVSWRDDFGEMDADEMVQVVNTGGSSGIPIPPDTVMLTALVKPDLRRSDVGLTARMRGASGRYYTLTIGTLTPRSVTLQAMERFPCEDVGLAESEEPLTPQNWCRIGAPISAAQLDEGEVADLTLEFIGISRRPSEEPLQLGVGSVAIADISAVASDGTVRVLTQWEHVRQERTPGGGFGDLGARIDPLISTGDDGALLTWSQPSWRDLKGVAIGDRLPVVDVIGGPWFRDSMHMQVDDEMRAYFGGRDVTVIFRGFADYFPTFGSGQSQYLITDLQAVRDILVINDPASGDTINELWIDLKEFDSETLREIDELVSFELTGTPTIRGSWIERSRFVADPLAYQGWSSFLTIGLASVIGVTGLAFAVNGWTTYKLRTLEVAVLRSMGLTDRQWLLLIILEQAVPPLVATAVGIGIGTALSAVLLPYMAGVDAEELAPPMLVSTDWRTFGTTMAIFGCTLGASIASVTIWTRRQQINLVLRAGGGIG